MAQKKNQRDFTLSIPNTLSYSCYATCSSKFKKVNILNEM
jgi:hypothetical protein